MDAAQIIAQLRADPSLRDLLRAVLLSDDLLQLPAVVRLQGENLAHLTDRVDQLTERVDQLAVAITAQARAFADLVGVVGDQANRMDRLIGLVENQGTVLARIEARLD